MGFTKAGPRGYGNDDALAFWQYDYSFGLNIMATPQQLDDRELTMALNVYLRAEGGVEMRKGIKKRGPALSATPGKSVCRFFQQVVSGAPVALTATTIGQCGGSLFNVDTGAAIGAANAIGTNAQAMSVVRIYDQDHAGGTDVLVICTGDGGPYLYDGTTISTPAGWASAAGARWCAALNGILWFGGIKAQPNLLVGSQLGHPETLPYYNSFVCDGPITGLCPSGNGPQSGLVIGMNRGLHVLYGTGSLNWYLQSIPMMDGVVAGLSMIAVNGIVYFLGRLAIYAFDGQNALPISKKVEPWILNDPLAPDFPMNGNRAISYTFFYNNRLYFAYDSGNVGYCNAYLVYHIDVNGGWTVLSGPKLAGACLLDAPGDGVGTGSNPAPCVVMDATTGQAYNWDVYNGSGTNGHGVDDNGSPIQTLCISKYFKVGEPGTTKKITRIYPELFVESFGGQAFVNTNYGAGSSGSVLNTPASAGTLVWDVGSWDVNTWAGNPLQFLSSRIDVAVPAEAFAFGIITNDTNPPYRFVGLSGTYAQEARN